MNPSPSSRTAAGVTVSLTGRCALVTGAATPATDACLRTLP